MNTRSFSSVASSLTSAAFRTVQASDSGGLLCRVRREIVTLRRFREDPSPPLRAFCPHGRIRTNRDIRKVRT